MLLLWTGDMLRLTARKATGAVFAVSLLVGLPSCGHVRSEVKAASAVATSKPGARQLALLTLSFSSPCRTESAPVRMPFPVEGGEGRVVMDLKCQAASRRYDLGLALRRLDTKSWRVKAVEATETGKGEVDIATGARAQLELGEATIEIELELVDAAPTSATPPPRT